jgi:pimeloyl-ACP methyl ester carboxylesterase
LPQFVTSALKIAARSGKMDAALHTMSAVKSRFAFRRGLVVVAALCAASCEWRTAAGTASHGTLASQSCPSRVPQDGRCFELSVHENRSARSGRLIPLRIVVLPARDRDRTADPIFSLAGGPGQAATDIIQYSGIPDALRSRHDFVFVDQRGTGGSNSLTCEFYGPSWNPQSYFEPFLPIAKVRECRDRLSPRADLTQYTTANSADDMDDVRRALGYTRINVVGGSYGTRLAMEYVRRYEPQVRSVILEGVAGTSTHVPENFGVLAQQALDALLDECGASGECASAFPSIRDKARAVFARLSEGPVRAKVRHPSGQASEVVLTRENVAEAIRYMTYSSFEATRVPLVLQKAYEGDYSRIAQYLLRRRQNGTFDGVYLSITCAEDVPFVSDGAEERDAATYLGRYRLREQRAACAEWPRGPAPDWIGRPVKAQVPVLLISGALDPATPPANGIAVAKMLPNSLHVTIPSGGHSAAGLIGLECLEDIKTTFLERGSVEALDTGCIAGIRRPPFATAAGQ